MRKTLAAIAAGVLLLFTVAACGSGSKPAAPEHHEKKAQHSEVYHDSTSGHTYAQAYNDEGLLVWWILWTQTNTPYYSSSPVTSLPSSSSWSRADTGGSVSGTSSYAPNTGALTSTSRVVTVNEDGEPEVEEGELSPDTEVPADEVTDLDTSPEEAQADAAFDNQVDADNANIDSGVEGDSGNVGGDSGDIGGNSGGDSGGGGDFSGGDSGGSFDGGGGGDFGG